MVLTKPAPRDSEHVKAELAEMIDKLTEQGTVDLERIQESSGLILIEAIAIGDDEKAVHSCTFLFG